jgi:PAS domain S-box-containing protein
MNKPTKELAVLIVEDSESDAQFIVRLLKKADYELVYEQVETAEQMRTALEKRAWDIVISDYRLPQFDGRAALKLLQEMGRDIPFVVVSGTIGEEIAVAMMKAGAHDYLIKGDLGRLVPAVERELNQAGIRRERKRAVERFELIKDSIDAASDGAYWMDREGWFIYVNDAGCKALGYSRDELLQLRIFDVNQRVTAQRWDELWQVLRDKKVFTTESVHCRKDGSEFPVEITSSYIKFGNQEYVNEFARDISERMQAQEALRESEARYRSLFDHMLDGMYRSTHAGKFVDVNPAMVRMFGYSSKEEMLEVDIKKELYFDPAERGSHILDTGQQEVEVYRMRRKDGTEIWVEDHGYYVHDEQGRIIFHEGMMRDVTERVHAKDALAASETELRALFASMQDVVLVIDREGVYRKIAPTNPGLLVKLPVELLGRNLRDVFPLEKAGSLIGTVRQVLDTKQTTQVEYELLIGDRNVWFEVFISPMDKDSTLWVARDVSARKLAEEALRETEERFRSVFENVTIGLYRTTPDGHILLANTTFARMLGCESIDELIQRNKDGDFVLIEYPRTEFLRLMETQGEVRGFEAHGKRMDGTVIFFRENAKAVRDNNGKILYFEGAVEDITERKRAEMETQQRMAEQGIIHQVSQSLLTARLDLDAIYSSLHEAVARLMPCETFTIVLDDPNGGDYHAVYLYDAGQRYPASHVPRGQGLSGRVISTGETLFIHDNLQSQVSSIRFGSPKSTRSILAVPLRKEDDIVGMISVQSYQPNMYGERQRVLLETLAAQVTVVIENARLYEKIQNELTERVQAEVALRTSEERYRELFNSMIDGFALHEIICDENGKPIDYRFLEVNPAYERLTGLQSINLIGKTVLEVMPNTEPYWIEIYGNVALTGRSTFFENYSGELGHYFEVSAYCPRPGQFAVIMVDITERKRAEETLNRHAEELTALQATVLDISSPHPLLELLNLIVERAANLIGASSGGMYLTEPEHRRVQCLISNKTKRDFTGTLLDYGVGAAGYVAETGKPIIIDDYRSWSGRADVYEDEQPFQAVMSAPLLWQGKVTGVIHLLRDDASQKFTQDELNLLLLFANHAAVAVENARLFDVTRQRVMELETLYQSGLALSQLLNPKEIGRKILELLKEKLGWQHTRIRLYHPQDDSLELLDFNQPGLMSDLERHEMAGHFQSLITHSDQGMSGWVIKHGQPARSGDVSNDPRYIEAYSGIHSGLYVPMKLGERMIGVISIESEQPDAFSEADERLLATLANQAASAFENARLFEVARQRVMEVETLNRISLILRTVSKQDEMLSIVLDEALAILNTSHGSIELWDDVNDILLKKAVRGWFAQVIESSQKSGEGISGKVITGGEIYISREFASDPMVRAESRDQIPPGWGGACLPIRTAQRMLGILIVSVPSERELNRDEIRLLSTLAEMTGNALHRMQLFDETARRAEEFASLYETSKTLSAENELNALLQGIIEHAQTLLHSNASGIYLYDEEHQDVEIAVYTVPYMSPGIRQGLGEGVAGRVAQTRQSLRVDDYSTWEGRSPKFVGTPFRAVLGVPMLYGGELVGVLMADEIGGSERKFSEADERLLSLFALQAAGAIHSARLFDETARRAEEFASLYETSKILSAETDLNALLQSIVEHAKILLRSAASGIYLYDEERQEVEPTVYIGPNTPLGIHLKLGEGVAGHVAQTRQPLRIDDYSTWEGRSPKFAADSFRSILDVPMLYGGELIGVLAVSETGDAERKFTEADERLLSLFAFQAAGAIHSARLHEETVHRLEHLQALRAVDQAIASSLDMRLTLNILLTHTLPQLGADAADVLLLHPGSNLLEVASSRGFRTRLLENVTVSESFAGRAVMEHHTVTVSDIETARRNSQFERLWKEEGFSAYWCVPLIVKGEVRGVLEVYRRTAFTPDPEWLEFLEILAGQAAIAIDNTQLFENLQRANTDLILAYNATIEGWSRALDLRDKETEGHTRRVADLTVAIAKAMGVKEQEILHIRRGALLHDIGKMGIPDYILLKPDKLTDEEWAIMRTHPQLARDLLMPIAYLRDALDIPYSHHEKWDGTGYPQGLKGSQIPATARFFAVVDVWDALTSNRPYRKKWAKKKALTYIQEQRGRHFDPQVVDAFVKIIKVK